ncbi:MAG: SWIM zinc finger domain-containing protein [Oscillospiraceae bacterium]|nr:SWIM zinc finger domain-containing protein [Oscillospiraceae bacterium]
MGLIECASGASAWRGYDYYREKKVLRIISVGDGVFVATVAGSSTEPYTVTIDVNHPRKSKCNCPHADGKRIVCKHMIAAYFAAFPEKADEFYEDYLQSVKDEEEWEEEVSERLRVYVNSQGKKQLQEIVLELLYDGPDWQYDRFIREHELDEDY